MTWFWLTLGVAFLQGLKDVFIRSGARRPAAPARAPAGAEAGTAPPPKRGGDVWLLSALFSGAISLGVLPLLLLEGIPEVRPAFWSSLVLSGLLLCATNVLYVQALRASDLSLTAPLLTFTPLFMLVTSPLMLGEFPGPGGLMGMLLIVAGSYVLNLQAVRRGIFAPFLALASQPGSRCMLGVAFLWSVTANYDKIGIQASSVALWLAALNGFVTLGLAGPALWRSRGRIRLGRREAAKMVAAGGIEALSQILQMTALTMTLAPYVISVKRFSAVTGVLLAWLILKERGVAGRLAGAAIMAAGVCLVAFG